MIVSGSSQRFGRQQHDVLKLRRRVDLRCTQSLGCAILTRKIGWLSRDVISGPTIAVAGVCNGFVIYGIQN